MSPIRFRKSVGLGPLRLNVSRRGVSPTVRVGRVSRSLRTGRTSVNLPGPFTWFSGGRRK
jgi:hypothetical protein